MYQWRKFKAQSNDVHVNQSIDFNDSHLKCANERKSKALASLNLYALQNAHQSIALNRWAAPIKSFHKWNSLKFIEIYLENISACDDEKMDKMEQYEALKVA